GGRSSWWRTGSGSYHLRRPRFDPSLDGFRSARPLRHHGLCPLRSGGRQAAGKTQSRREAKTRTKTRTGPPATAAAVVPSVIIAGLRPAFHDAWENVSPV